MFSGNYCKSFSATDTFDAVYATAFECALPHLNCWSCAFTADLCVLQRLRADALKVQICRYYALYEQKNEAVVDSLVLC